VLVAWQRTLIQKFSEDLTGEKSYFFTPELPWRISPE